MKTPYFNDLKYCLYDIRKAPGEHQLSLVFGKNNLVYDFYAGNIELMLFCIIPPTYMFYYDNTKELHMYLSSVDVPMNYYEIDQLLFVGA